MAKYRKRFNDKARAGAVAKRDELKKARNKHLRGDNEEPEEEDHRSVSTTDSNATELVPISKEEKEQRKRKMAEDVNRNAPGVSSKKRKRLDKYIDRQLRKQENAELIEKISKNEMDTSGLQSMRNLGTGTRKTKRQKFEEALQLENEGKGTDETKDLLYEEHQVKDWRDSEHFKEYQDQGPEPEEEEEQAKTSSFVDNRPSQPVSGFGFQNLPTLSRTSKPKYNWRSKLAEENTKKYERKKKDKAMYFEEDDDSPVTSSEEGEEDDKSEGDEEEEDGSDEDEDDVEKKDDDDEEEEEEWSGFSDTELPVQDDDEEYDESDEEESDEEVKRTRGRGSDFKQWVNSLNGVVERKEGLDVPEFHGEYIPVERPEDQEELADELKIQDNAVGRKVDYIHVHRPDELQTARLQLPVVGEEHRLMEAIHHNDCTVICGETGSGKTTQVPQFLFEAGYTYKGMIGVTQPRRVAAVSMANRVGTELADHGRRVGYQIRFDASTKEDTAIKFMTDGVLLRELSADFTLSKYSVILIDEAHERNINTDILIGVLSRVIRLRKEQNNPLKLVVMSATLRVTDFTENTRLFDSPPPVLKVEARQHPVSVHFNRRTHANYLDQVYDKTVKIHQRLPSGGILIFLTGQNEITGMVKRLRKQFPQKRIQEEDNVPVRVNAKEATTEVEDVEFGLEEKLEDFDEYEDDGEDDEVEEEGFEETLEEGQDSNAPLHVLPLYSLLPTREQMKVFDAPPEGSRLVVVATNVAETSLTIPGIRYVVDCGRSKERHYDERTGVQSFKVSWVSKASANQRAGRAGRTGPGHCYRIFSSAVYENDFPQFTPPEIERMPIEGVVLQMKFMGIHNILNFPFPSPPPHTALQKGLNLLKYLGALDNNEGITELGNKMSLFPLSPRFAKMLLLGNQQECLAYVVTVVAGLTVGDPFIQQHEIGIDKQEDDEDETVETKEIRRKMRGDYFKAQARFSALDDTSDVFKLLTAVCAFDYDKTESFAHNNFLRYKTMEEICKLRKQVAYIVATNTQEYAANKTIDALNAKLKPPSKKQVKALKQMVTSGYIDQIAIRADLLGSVEKEKRVENFPYATLFPSTDAYSQDPYVYVHPASLVANLGEDPPQYLVYSGLSQSEVGKKVRIKPLCDIEPKLLANVAKNSALITYSKPQGIPEQLSTTKRKCVVTPRFGAAIGRGGVGWDLPPVQVIQVKKGTSWVVQ